MAMIARSPVWGSWQNTTCSCPPRAAGTWAAASWGYTGAIPPRVLAKTFVTVVTLLASSRVLVDADLASSVCPTARARPKRNGDATAAVPRRQEAGLRHPLRRRDRPQVARSRNRQRAMADLPRHP